VLGSLLEFTPVVDGVEVTTQAITSLRSGNYDSNVPVIFGNNKEEGVTFVYDALTKDLSMFVFKAGLAVVWPSHFSKVVSRYVKSDKDARAPLSRIATDFLFTCPVQQFAIAQAKRGKSSWVYRFDHVYSNPSMFSGLIPSQCATSVCHGVELPIVFHNGAIDASKQYHPNSPQEDKLSDLIIGYWSNFARTGNPNGEGLPKWDPFDAKTRSVFVIGDDKQTSQVGGMVSYADACAMWDQTGYGTGGALRFRQMLTELENEEDNEEDCEEEESEESEEVSDEDAEF
jgi:carboxylesterase type B